MKDRSDFLWLTCHRLFLVVLGLFQSIMINRALGPEGKGLLYFGITTIGFISLLLSVGIPTAIVYSVGRATHPRDQLLSLVALLTGVMSVPAVALFSLVYYYYNSQGQLALTATEMLLFGGVTVLAVSQTFWPFVAQAEQKHKQVIVATSISSTFYCVGLYAMYCYERVDLLTVLSLLAISQLLGLVHLLYLLGKWHWVWPSWQHMRELFVIGRIPYASNLVQTLNYRVDTYFLAGYRGQEQLGWYSVAQSLSELIWVGLSGLGMLLPTLLRREEQDRVQLACRVTRVMLLVFSLPSLALVAGGASMISLFYGQAFAPATQALIILMPGVYALIIPKVLANYFGAHGDFLINLKGSIIGVMVNLTLTWFLVVHYGFVGAACGTSISYIVMAWFMSWAFIKKSGVHWSQLLVPKWQDVRFGVNMLMTAWR